jgi:hypothetical protein
VFSDLNTPLRPLRLSLAQRWRYERHGVPKGRRPLAAISISSCFANGLDVEPGQLVQMASGRWAIVYLDIRASA